MGVGGRTIREAKANMSFAEAQSWRAYTRRRGSVNLIKRMDYGLGQLSWIVHRLAGGKAELREFIPYSDEPEAHVTASASDVLAYFGRMKK